MAEWGYKRWQCHRDGEPKGAIHRQYSHAWMEMHQLQGQSVAWACKFEGWSIEEVTKDGEIVTETEADI
jgi:hypothetical protein